VALSQVTNGFEIAVL